MQNLFYNISDEKRKFLVSIGIDENNIPESFFDSEEYLKNLEDLQELEEEPDDYDTIDTGIKTYILL